MLRGQVETLTVDLLEGCAWGTFQLSGCQDTASLLLLPFYPKASCTQKGSSQFRPKSYSVPKQILVHL